MSFFQREKKHEWKGVSLISFLWHKTHTDIRDSTAMRLWWPNINRFIHDYLFFAVCVSNFFFHNLLATARQTFENQERKRGNTKNFHWEKLCMRRSDEGQMMHASTCSCVFLCLVYGCMATVTTTTINWLNAIWLCMQFNAIVAMKDNTWRAAWRTELQWNE